MEAFFDQIPRGLRLDSNISAQNAERRRRIRNKRKRERKRGWERGKGERGASCEGARKDEKATDCEREPDVERYLLIGLQEFSI